MKKNYGKIQIHKWRKETHISTATVRQYFGWKRDTLVFEISYIRNAKEDLPYKRIRNWGEFKFSVDLSKVEKPAPCVLYHHNQASMASTLEFNFKVALFTKKGYKFEDSVKLLWFIPTVKQSHDVILYQASCG